MLDLSEAAVDTWFLPVRLPSPDDTWPPGIRQIERAKDVRNLLQELGHALSEVANENPQAVQHLFTDDRVLRDLQIAIAQLGAARLLRITDWFAASQHGGEMTILQLAGGVTAEGKALSSCIRALTARATITRMFGPLRASELQACAERAQETQEKF